MWNGFQEEMNSLMDTFDRYSCTGVWQTVGDVGLELGENAIKNWSRLMHGLF